MRRALLPIVCVLLSAASPAAAAEGAGDSLLTPQIGTVFWTLVTFLIMVVLLGRYAWGPLMAAVDARERSIRDSIEKAGRDRQEAESLISQHRELLTAARRERAEAVEAGKRDAEKVKSDILDEARKQREQLLAQSKDQIKAGIRQAQTELRTLTVDLAIQAAEKLLSRSMDDATQRKLVEDYLDELERSPAS